MSWEPIVVALIALFGVLASSSLSNRKTRRMNTEEHELGAKERQRAHEAQMELLHWVKADVSTVKRDVGAVKAEVVDLHLVVSDLGVTDVKGNIAALRIDVQAVGQRLDAHMAAAAGDEPVNQGLILLQE